MVKQLIRGPCHNADSFVAACLVCTSAGSAVREGLWRQGDRSMDRKLNRLVCVLIGFMTFELPQPNRGGRGRCLVNLLSYRGP